MKPISDLIMGNCCSSNSSSTPHLPHVEGMVGTYRRVSCTGMEELLRVQTGFDDQRAKVAGKNDTPCNLIVEFDDSTNTWTMKYMRSNMEQIIMFYMPKHAKVAEKVVRVINVPARTTPQPRMEVARNSTGRSLQFSDTKMKKGTIRMERKFTENFMEVTQVVSLRGKEVKCVEKFIRSEYNDA